MNLSDFIDNFSEQFEEIDFTTITGTSKFRDLDEWDSFAALSIIAMVDEQYNVKITGEDIRKSNTVEEIFEFVKSKL